MGEIKLVSVRRKSNRNREFKAGDIVQFRYVAKDIRGKIIEDRGSIGRGGQHLYRVLIDADNASRELELPADELRKISG